MIKNLFYEYDTDIIIVSDLKIITNGIAVDAITNDSEGIKIWAGNPITDKYSEELVLSKEERKRIFEEILEAM